jgi:hypothetical protein
MSQPAETNFREEILWPLRQLKVLNIDRAQAISETLRPIPLYLNTSLTSDSLQHTSAAWCARYNDTSVYNSFSRSFTHSYLKYIIPDDYPVGI